MINWFERLLMKENVSENFMDKLCYSYDGSGVEGSAQLVVWPKDPRQVHHIILFAKRIGAHVLIRGAGTSEIGAVIPDKAIVIDTTKMNRTISFSETSKTIVVEPGVFLKDINNFLKKYNLEFPIKPRNYEVTTIGSIIARNAFDHKAKKIGKTKDWIEYIDVIDGNGRLMKVDTDNLKFFCGREGASGIIVKAKLRLNNIIEEESISVETFDYIEELAVKVEELKDKENVMFLEYLGPKAADIIGLDDNRYTLIIGYEDKESGDMTNKKQIKKIKQRLNDIRHRFYRKDYKHDFDCKIPIEKLTKFLNWLKDNKIPSSGYANLGIIHGFFNEDTKEKIDDMYELAKSLGGSVIAENGVGLIKKKYVDQEYREKIKVLKSKYDPVTILNRGKVI